MGLLENLLAQNASASEQCASAAMKLLEAAGGAEVAKDPAPMQRQLEALEAIGAAKRNLDVGS